MSHSLLTNSTKMMAYLHNFAPVNIYHLNYILDKVAPRNTIWQSLGSYDAILHLPVNIPSLNNAKEITFSFWLTAVATAKLVNLYK